MGVSTVTEIYEGRGGSTGIVDSDVRVFDVVTDSGTDNRYTIIESGRIPVRGNPHNTRSNLTCKTVDIRPKPGVRSPRHWRVKCEYDNQPLGSLPENKSIEPNPLLRPIEIEGRSTFIRVDRSTGALIATKTQTEWDSSKNGLTIPTQVQALQNTAGDPFERLEENYPIWILDCTLNAEAIQDWVRLYQKCVNNSEVVVDGYSGVFPRWSLMMMEWSHSNLKTEKLPSGLVIGYYSTKFSLWYKRNLWVTPVLNQGFFSTDGEGRRKECRSRFGLRKQEKTLLDEAGRELEDPSPSKALYRWYADGPEVDYSVFKLSV